MSKIDQCIILFAREPVLGTVKSRLSAALSPQETLTLYKRLLIQSINIACRYSGADVQVFSTPGIDHPLLRSYAKSHQMRLHIQTTGDLGARMIEAAESMLQKYQRVLIMGSDCPFITQAYLDDAFSSLNDKHVAFGPALDGGFVLTASATSGLFEKVFRNVDWGESTVLESVLEHADSEEISYELLPPLQDIDRPEDLGLLEQVTWFE